MFFDREVFVEVNYVLCLVIEDFVSPLFDDEVFRREICLSLDDLDRVRLFVFDRNRLINCAELSFTYVLDGDVLSVLKN